MSDLKICEFVDTYYPTVDGAINVVKQYSEMMSRRAICKLASPKPARKDKYVDKESFEVIRCSSTPAPENYRSALPIMDGKFIDRIIAEKFDILHAHTPFAMGRFALHIGKKYKIPVVATLHTQYHLDFERVLKGNKALVKFMVNYILKLYKNADSVWTVSDKACEILRSYGYKGNIEVVRNATEFSYPENATELIEKVNAIHDLYTQRNVFIFVGRMAWYKNIGLICDALKTVKQLGKDFKMLFVGGGFDLGRIKRYAKKLDIEDKIIFTGEVKDRELLQGYYLRSDLMIFPSTFDTAGIVKVEAAAHKKAGIFIENSCSGELVEHGKNGFLCEENAQSIADGVLELCDREDYLKEIGEVAYKTLYRSWDMLGDEVIEKYEKIVADYQQKLKKENRRKKLLKALRNKKIK